MKLKTLLFLTLASSLFAVSCGSSGGSSATSNGTDTSGTTPTTSVSVQVSIQSTGSGAMFNALGTASDIVSLSVAATKASDSSSLGTSALSYDGTNWVGTLIEIPLDTSVNFTANAYNSSSVAIFTGTSTQTLTSGGSTLISISLSSIDDGVVPTNPEIVSASLPNLALAGSNPLPIAFTISHASTINYSLTTTAGGLGLTDTATPVTTLTGTHDPSTNLSMYFFPPSTASTAVLTLSVSAVSGSDEVGAGYAIATIEEDPNTWTDPDVVIVIGPALTGMEFFRSETALKVTVTTDPDTGLTYSWSGTGSFASVAFTGNPLFINAFTDAMAGEVSVTVSDTDGNTASLSRTIAAGDFPYDVTNYIADLPGLYIYDETTNLMWQDNTNKISRKWADAGQYCADLNVAGYDVWRLATVSELVNMFDRVADFSSYFTGQYWSSEEVDASNASTVDYTDGSEGFDGKTRRNYVRCVRLP